MPSSSTNASSMTPCRFFCNDEVACQSRRSRFHCRYVHASVGAQNQTVVPLLCLIDSFPLSCRATSKGLFSVLESSRREMQKSGAFLYSAHCSFRSTISLRSMWCRRAMIPGEIFTSFAEFQGIVSVNDFWFPLGFQELLQASLGFL